MRQYTWREDNKQINTVNFFDIKNIGKEIVKRRLNFVGKIVRMSDDKVPARLISV